MLKEVDVPCTCSREMGEEVENLQQELADQRDRFSRLIHATSRISHSLDSKVVLGEVIESACVLTGARYGVLLTYNESGGVRDVFTCGMTPEEIDSIEYTPRGTGLLGYLNRTREPVRISNIASHPECVRFPENHPPMKSFLGMQIRHNGEHVGNIFLTEKEAGEDFTEEDEEAIVMFVSLAATAISNARRYEREFRARTDLETLFSISPVGVAVIDAMTGEVLSHNPEIQRLFCDEDTPEGPLNEHLARMTFRRFDGREIPPDEFVLNRVFQFGEKARAEEVVAELPSGRVIPTLVNAAPVYSEEGELVSAMVAVQDMTPIMDMERVRAEFLGMVSEELRMPLTTIKGSVAALSQVVSDLDETEPQQLVRIIDQQADLMRSQVNSLVELTDIKTGNLLISPESAEISDLVYEATRDFLKLHAGTEIEIDLSKDLPRVIADRQRIGQVLNNLFFIVARHTHGSSAVKVTISQVDVYLIVSVSPVVRGASPHDPSSLLKRAKGTHGDEIGKAAGGEQLALTMCRGIVEAHGGRMRVESDPSGGSIAVSFTIPAADEMASVIQNGSAHPENCVPQSTENARILVSVDDPRLMGTIRRVLSRAEYIPVEGHNSSRIELDIEDQNPRLILLDLTSHKTAGLQLTQRLSSEYGLPVIVLSGEGDDNDIEQAFAMGAEDYIVKPFSPTELVARIRAAIRKRSSFSRASSPGSYQCGKVAVDYTGRTVTVSGELVHMTATEYNLLVELSSKAGRVVSQDELLQRVWGPEYLGEPQLLRSYVKSLRQKLGDSARSPSYIFTEHGIGYRMQKP